MSAFGLRDLETILQHRAAACVDESYTAKLLAGGIGSCSRKLGEETIELIIEALGQDRQRIVDEAADVLYHLLVVLLARDIGLDEVYAALEARSGQSGLQEKASRQAP